MFELKNKTKNWSALLHLHDVSSCSVLQSRQYFWGCKRMLRSRRSSSSFRMLQPQHTLFESSSSNIGGHHCWGTKRVIEPESSPNADVSTRVQYVLSTRDQNNGGQLMTRTIEKGLLDFLRASRESRWFICISLFLNLYTKCIPKTRFTFLLTIQNIYLKYAENTCNNSTLEAQLEYT